MDLATRYLGFDLPHPFIPGASPLADDLGAVRRLEDAGAAAIVLRSLFEEQIDSEAIAFHLHLERWADAHAEAGSYLPGPDQFVFGPEEYLEHLAAVRDAVDLPVIASLNGTTEGRWLEYARLIAEAGASALELNLYQLSTDPDEGAVAVERRLIDVVGRIRQSIDLPLAVKLSPFFTALAAFARDLEEAGADGLVLFNRFYQADIDVDELEVERSLHLSDSSELLLRLRWLAVLSSQRRLSLAVTGGVHTVVDAVKAIMSGARAVQVVSVLLEKGPGFLADLRRGLAAWLEEHEYDSLAQLHASMDLTHCPDPSAYERANYMRILQGARVP